MMSALRKRLAPAQLHHSAGHDPAARRKALFQELERKHGGPLTDESDG
jgi:hypothetical protein